MKVLLLYPLFPKSFWSFEKALELVGRKALLPPLALITVAAILPQQWEFKLVDRNVAQVTEEQWNWAQLIIISGMMVQRGDFLEQIKEAKHRKKRVAVGGPYATSLPNEVQEAGADYLVLDEGEITLPMLVEAIEQGKQQGIFRAEEKPDISITPIPRYDLLDLTVYSDMSVQFSRGCPFQCEFCDIITLYGRKSRTKTPAQFLRELEYLYQLGWGGDIFVVDDNFIGNKKNVKLLLKELKVWMSEKNYPFGFYTEASVDLAKDQELMELMVEANFTTVFLGIETPDEDSLTLTKKFQNTQEPLIEAVNKITHMGLKIMAGFIIGFDGEKTGAGDRIVKFVEETGIPLALLTMLQVLPHTGLWTRLEKEGRLIKQEGDINQTTLINFVPTRPVEEIAKEYIEAFWELYDPEKYLDRTFRYYMKLGTPRHSRSLQPPNLREFRALLILIWRQGIVRNTRWKFWINLVTIIRHKPSLTIYYLTKCGFFEHFFEYRLIVRDQINTKLANYKLLNSL